jgi:two-component system CheB/CheR fusion protein
MIGASSTLVDLTRYLEQEGEVQRARHEAETVNEELQSSNEELETAKEEMQSVNEELQTVNAEMASKNDVLTHLNSDIKNLLESTEIATLFLDEQLRIKSFTNGVADIFSVRDTDIGRPITEIVGLSDYATLQADVRMVLRKLTVIERKVARNDGSMSFVLRIRPYRTVDNVIDGVVCTFVDMTEREAADAMLRESESQFHALADLVPQLAWIADAGGEVFWFNRRWYEYTGTSRADMERGGWNGVHHPDQIDPMLARFKRCVAAGKPWEDTYQLRGADGEYRWLLSRAEPIHDSGGKSDRFHCARNGSRDPTAGVLDR